MMNKFINWVFGSFFRTFGRFLFYIVLGLLLSYLLKDVKIPGLFNILDVYAANSGLWVGETLHIEEADFYNWTGANTYSHMTTQQGDYEFYTNNSIQNDVGDILDYRQIYYTYNINLGSYGVSFVVKMPTQLTSNVLYNVNLYMCTKNSVPSAANYGIRAGSSYTNSLTADYNYSSLTRIGIGSAGFVESGASNTWPNCYLYSGFVDTKQSGAYVNFRLTGSTTGEHALIGITYQTVGLTNGLTRQDVSSVISNSGLASATSVSQVQQSVNQVQQELSDVNSSIEDQTEQQQQNHDELMDNLNDDDTSESVSSASDFFSDFSTNTHGLTGIITAPLSAIQSLTSKTCSSLVLPLPFVDEDLTLPCMRSLYTTYFGDFMEIYDIITLGIISYWVMVRIFSLVKDFKNPDHDEIEVLDL